MQTKFWKNKTIFLTGHTGFKGSWLTLWLTSLGANVIGYALPPHTEPNLFELGDLESKIISIIGDIRDYKHLQQILIEHEPDIVIHMAAQALVMESYNSPVETYATNVMGTVNLLEAIRTAPSVKAVLNVTTDKCYDNKEWLWGYREEDPLGGKDPYSSSKACSELVTAAYRQSFFSKRVFEEFHAASRCKERGAQNRSLHVVNEDSSTTATQQMPPKETPQTPSMPVIATARAGNVIGGGDWSKNRLIPDMIQAFTLNQPLLIRHPEAIRPWQHILDVLHGYMLLVEALWSDLNTGDYAEAWNFGPLDHNIKPVAWVADKMSELWGENSKRVFEKFHAASRCKERGAQNRSLHEVNEDSSTAATPQMPPKETSQTPSQWITDQQSYLPEASYLKLDSSKSRMRLGWESKLSLTEALAWTVDWYKAYLSGESIDKIILQQINRYETEYIKPIRVEITT